MTIDLSKHGNVRKLLHCDEGTGKTTAYILVGYCPDTLAYFRYLAELARKDFPKLKDEDIICGKVKQSDWCYGFTLILFPIKFPINHEKAIAKGWSKRLIDFNY